MNKTFGIIVEPHLTEKVVGQKELENKVVFKVHPGSNKIEIKNAIQKIFEVTVLKVATQNVNGKRKRQGRIEGKRKDWKKAVVTLKQGDKIDYFEGA